MKLHQYAMLMGIGFFLLISLSGCSDSKSTAENQDAVSPAGIWLGTQMVLEKDADGNVVSNVFDMKTIIYDGRFYGISEDAGIVFSGTYEMGPEGRLITNGLAGGGHSYKMYSIATGGESWVNGVARLDFKEKKHFTGMFQNDARQEGELEALYSPLYEKGAKLDDIAGTFVADTHSLTIDSAGHINGSKNGCEISGAVSVPEAGVNIYELNYALSGGSCTKAGTYIGVGMVALDSNSEAYFLGLTSNNDETRMDGVFFYLDGTPFTLALARIDNAVSDIIGLENGEKISKIALAALNPGRWPSLISEAQAESLLGNQWWEWAATDFSDSDFQHESEMYNDSAFTYSAVTHLPYVDLTNYSDSNFNGIRIGWGRDRLDLWIEGFNNTIFDGADMKNVVFNRNEFGFSIARSTFQNTNLEGSNISDAIHYDKVGIFDQENALNDFSGAWWEDGRRCGLDLSLLMGDNECYERTFDTGLTYAEWKNGKWDAEKAAENIVGELKDAADDGIKFAKNVGDGVVKSISSWW